MLRNWLLCIRKWNPFTKSEHLFLVFLQLKYELLIYSMHYTVNYCR